LINQSKGFQQRAIYRDHLSQLNDGVRWEIQPDDETLHKLKVNVRRAATAFCLKVGPFGILRV
jgi:CHAD domain-containing protein